MKNEIKENNSVMKCCICNNENIGEFIVIDDKKYHLNCITNSQEELEDLREDNYAYHQLIRMENKREYRSKFLKEFQEEFGTNTFPDYDEIYKRYDKVKKENERLKYLLDDNNSIKAFVIEHNKVDKAIELLKEAGCYDEETKTFCDDVWEELPELLNILNGGDDNAT